VRGEDWLRANYEDDGRARVLPVSADLDVGAKWSVGTRPRQWHVRISP
jgi:hypothetical protein